MINLPNSIKENGLRLDDKFELHPFQKGKRNLELKRTRYEFISGEDLTIDYLSCVVNLPALKNESFRYVLELINVDGCDKNKRYFLKSLGEDFFRLNGVWCKEAFLERGDILDLGFNRLIFREKRMKNINEGLEDQGIKSNLPILIEGETGTGKTTLAKEIHLLSGVSGNFVHLNLASYSEGIVESELFGHIKGAFTGAINDKKGAIAEAQKGTLFLDEIDSISIELQTKLLLFLESGEYRPVGSNVTHKCNTRFIFSSGRKLESLVEINQMRKDFYFRLMSGFKIDLKALRDSPEKIFEICKKFEEEEYVVLSEELIKFYQKLTWPGNLRQLITHLKKKKVVSKGSKLQYDEFDKGLLSSLDVEANLTGKILTLDEMRNNYAINTFHRLNQNITVTSKILNISPNTLRGILRKSA